MSKKKSPLTIFIAIAAAAMIGTFSGKETSLWGVSLYAAFDLLGTLYIKALTLVVVPLVSSCIITGIGRLGSEKTFGKLGLKTFSFYIGTSLLAILVGLLFVNLITPGSMLDQATTQATLQLEHSSSIHPSVNIDISSVLLQIIPSNIVEAFSSGQMLGLIFFSSLFGYAMSKIDTAFSSTLMSFCQGVFQTMIQVTHVIMKCLPLGVFCLVAKAFAATGLGSLHSLLLFLLTVLLSLSAYLFIALPLLLKFVGKVNPWRHFKAMSPALITAFSTSSSSATLPITIDCVEKRAGVSNRICSLVVPLGTSINMSGSALYECVAAMFVAQAYGIELSFSTQFIVVFMALITSIGVAGIPSGSLVAIIVILKTLGLPAEGIGLFLAVDRILDMCRTTVNVFSDSCCAVLVARSEGEQEVLSKTAYTS